LIAGKFASVIESNPLIGEKTASTVRKVLDGKKVEKTVTIKSKIFTPESAKEALSSRKY
jgi:ribosomal protein L19